MADFTRSDRVAVQLRKELSVLVHAAVRDHALPSASVSDVEVSRELDVANVYVTTLVSEQGPAAVAGCMVIEGTVRRNKPIRVLRDNTVIFQGELESLRRFKENVDEVRNGTECGIGVKQYNDVKPGDQIECFERIEVARTL